MLNRKHIRRRFEKAASSFDAADFLHATTREGLLARLEPLLIEADVVIDLGAATGSAGHRLSKRFRGAHVVAVDLAHNMLAKGRRQKGWFSKVTHVQADAERLPLADASVDVVFSNMLLPSIGNPDGVFLEVARVLRKGGVFAFATLGPDSLHELARAWRSIDDAAHVAEFADMHDLGDGLVRAGFRDPVLDVDRLLVSYENSNRLFSDLTAVGARNALSARSRGLTGRQRFDAMTAALDNAAKGGKITLDLELVFAHCFGGGPQNDPANFHVDANAIPIRRTG